MGSTWLEPTTRLLSLPLHASAASGLGLALLALLDARLSEPGDKEVLPTPLPGPKQGETPASFPSRRMQEARLHGNPFATVIPFYS